MKVTSYNFIMPSRKLVFQGRNNKPSKNSEPPKTGEPYFYLGYRALLPEILMAAICINAYLDNKHGTPRPEPPLISEVRYDVDINEKPNEKLISHEDLLTRVNQVFPEDITSQKDEFEQEPRTAGFRDSCQAKVINKDDSFKDEKSIEEEILSPLEAKPEYPNDTNIENHQPTEGRKLLLNRKISANVKEGSNETNCKETLMDDPKVSELREEDTPAHHNDVKRIETAKAKAAGEIKEDTALQKEFNYTLSKEEQKTVDYILSGNYSVKEANRKLNFTRNVIKELIKRGHSDILEDQFIAIYTSDDEFEKICAEENALKTIEKEPKSKTKSFNDTENVFSSEEMRLFALQKPYRPKDHRSTSWQADEYIGVADNNIRGYGRTANILRAARANHIISREEALFISEYLEELNGTMGNVLKKTPGEKPEYATLELIIYDKLFKIEEINKKSNGNIELKIVAEELTDDEQGTEIIYRKVEYTPGEDGRPKEGEKLELKNPADEPAEYIFA